ncbi:MAG: NAD(P)-dependent alcohol dehydrogenase [Candidatus Thorarchaeota archaeon]
MKAMVTTRYGPPEVLQIEEREKPIPKDNQVLVKIYTTTVSVGDVKMRSLDVPGPQKVLGRLFLGITKPRKDILGMEIAGEVVEVGTDVTKFEIGERVYASTFWEGLGGYTEFKCMNEDGMLAKIPDGVTYEEVVPLLGGGVTAAKVLKKGNIQPGQKVLIYGASGNVGSYAVQIAKYFGAEVIGVTSTKNLDWVKELGCNRVIDYTTTDFTQIGEKYDIVFDAVDKLPSPKREVSLNETGIYLNTNKDSGSGVGKSKDHIEFLVFLDKLLHAGKIRSIIDRTYPFDEIQVAHRYVETGRKRGSVVVRIVDSSK